MHAVAVALPRGDPGHVPVPDAEGALGEGETTLRQPPGSPSTRHTSTASAVDDATANRAPSGSTWAPNGKTDTIGEDMPRGRTRIAFRVVVSHKSEPAPSDPGDYVIRMEGVTVRRGDTTLLDSVDWTVELDERWVVLGPERRRQDHAAAAGRRRHPSDAGRRRVLGARLGASTCSSCAPRIGLSSAALGLRVPPDETVRDVVISAGYAVDRALARALRPAGRGPRGRAARRAGAARAGGRGPTGRCRRGSGSGR